MSTLTVRPRPLTASSAAYRPTRAEQETVLRWDRADASVHVWSVRLPGDLAEARAARGPRGARDPIPGWRRAISGRFYTIPLSRFRWGLKRTGATGGRPLGPRLAVRSAA
jgi:hypothetical protein